MYVDRFDDVWQNRYGESKKSKDSFFFPPHLTLGDTGNPELWLVT